MLQTIQPKTGTIALAKPERPKPTELRIERAIITPDIAKAWLSKNEGNRKVKRAHVAKLAREIKAGRFLFNGQPIQFDDQGRLINGQHRLLACVEADKHIDVLVVYGLSATTQATMDVNSVGRTTADILTMSGFHFANNLAASARLILSEKDGDAKLRSGWTTGEVQELIARHSGLPASVRKAVCARMPKGIPVSGVAAIHYLGSSLLNSPLAADEFVEVLSTGVPAYDGCAAHAYREKALRMGPMNDTSARISRGERWRLLKHAWNLFVAKKSAAVLRGAKEVGVDGLDYASL